MHATWNFFIEPSYFIILKISADDLICRKDSAIFAAGAEFTDCGSGPNLNAGCDFVAKFLVNSLIMYCIVVSLVNESKKFLML